MEVEHDIKVAPLDDNLKATLEGWAADGWELTPGIRPLAVYPVVRVKGAVKHQPGGLGTQANMTIDDSKVLILGADGKVRPQ